jgi:hypothetical protein
MALQPRFVHSLLVVACLFQALAVSPHANSQTPAAATPQEPITEPALQTTAGDSLGVWNNAEQQRMAYSGFLIEMANEESNIRGNCSKARQRPAPE